MLTLMACLKMGDSCHAQICTYVLYFKTQCRQFWGLCFRQQSPYKRFSFDKKCKERTIFIPLLWGKLHPRDKKGNRIPILGFCGQFSPVGVQGVVGLLLRAIAGLLCGCVVRGIKSYLSEMYVLWVRKSIAPIFSLISASPLKAQLLNQLENQCFLPIRLSSFIPFLTCSSLTVLLMPQTLMASSSLSTPTPTTSAVYSAILKPTATFGCAARL